MRFAPWKAAVRDETESRSAETISMPLEESAWAAGEDGLRVRPRMRHLGSERKRAATEPPWLPVMPIMTRSFLGVSVVEAIFESWCVKYA